MQKIKYVKQPVAVNVTIGPDGQVRPKKFMWKDGNWYTLAIVCYMPVGKTIMSGVLGDKYDKTYFQKTKRTYYS